MSDSNKVIRVAQVIGMAIDGGVEACIMNYYRNINKKLIQFDFLVESTSKIIDKEKIEAMGGRVIFIPSYKNPIKYMNVLTKIFKENKYDIVHSNMNTLSVFTLKAAKKAGIKVRIAHSHSTSNSKEVFRNIMKNILKRFSKKYATHYFACGELAGKWLFGQKTYKTGNITIINNGIYIDKFKFNKELRYSIRQRNNTNDKFIVGHVGRMAKQKNHDFLIDIFNEIQKQIPNSLLFLVGDGPLRNDLVEKAKKLNIADKIIFSGTHKHPQWYYHAFDCFVMPSLYEGLPVVSIEAQINGLPCFFSDSITDEIMINDNTYALSLYLTAKEWADVIIKKAKLDQNRDKYYFNFVNSKYDIVKESKILENIYMEMVG